jgi:hypothetical protein
VTAFLLERIGLESWRDMPIPVEVAIEDTSPEPERPPPVPAAGE